MSDINSCISILDDSKLSMLDKMNIVNNVKEILKASASSDEAAIELTHAFENYFNSKIEEIKEKLELKADGIFSTSTDGKKPSFKRIS